MNRIQKIIIIFVLCSFILPQKKTWASTRFENFWYSKVHKMKFRTPFAFMPFNIKVGYLKYGGTKYWEQWDDVFAGAETFDSNPINFQNINYFEGISEPKNRTMIIAEIDFFKYNFFKEKQNIVDVQFGIGYKFIKSINGVSHAPDKFFKPEIQEYNININFLIQLNKKRYYAISHSKGYAYADLYKSNNGLASGHGLSESFGLGLHFLRSRKFKKSLVHHGFEIRFNRFNINHIDDPLSIIDSFNIEQIGLVYSYGIGYGGEQSLGDDAYKDLLENDFISAVEKFQNFKAVNRIFNRNIEIDRIINFGLEQIPYQMYDKGIEDYNEGYLEQALWWMNKATSLADEYLLKKINKKKVVIITELLKGDFNNKTVNSQIDIVNDLRVYNENNEDLSKKLSSLMIKKASYYLETNNFFDAYFLYKEAMILNPDNEIVIKMKFEHYIIKVLNHAYKYLQNKDYVIAYEILSLISEFTNESEITKALSSIVFNKVEDDKVISIRQRMQNILYAKKDNIELGLSDIFLGQNYFIIVDLLGHPIEKVTKRRFDNVYDFSTFKIIDQNYRLFFKNKILIDIERPK